MRWLPILIVLLAGCSSLDPEAVLVDDNPLSRYDDCRWTDRGTSRHCEIPRSENYTSAVIRDFSEIDGWKCIVPSDFDPPEDGDTYWRFFVARPLSDGFVPATNGYRAGFQIDLGNATGPFTGIIWDVLNPDETRYTFQADAPRFFMEVPQEIPGSEALLQFVVLGDGFVAQNISSGGVDQPVEGAIIDARGIAVERIEQAWVRASGDWGGWPQPQATHVLHTDHGVRFVPTQGLLHQFHITDPRELKGNGHWGYGGPPTLWTDVAQGGASITMAQEIHIKGYVHYDNVHSLEAGWVCRCAHIEDDVWRQVCLATGGFVQPPGQRIEMQETAAGRQYTLAGRMPPTATSNP